MDLYAAHAQIVPEIARSVAARLPRAFEIEDLAQIGRMALAQACEAADPARADTFRLYLRQRVRGAILDAIRGAQFREACLERDAIRDDGVAYKPHPAAAAPRDPFVGRAVAALPARQRRVIVMRFHEDRSQAETAAALGVSRRTARREEAAALGRLRAQLTQAA